MAEIKKRYSDEDLAEFKQIIDEKLERARKDYSDMMKQVMDTIGTVLYERLRRKKIFDPNSGVTDEATPETYVEDVYYKK